MKCTNCNSVNRDTARYCKKCGKPVKLQSGQNEDLRFRAFSELIGLNELKESFQREIIAFGYMKMAGLSYDKRVLHTILIGNSGTGKNKIVDVLNDVLFTNEIISKPRPTVVAAAHFQEFSRNLTSNLDAAKGGILFIDNVHQLVPDGFQAGRTTPVDSLLVEMEKRSGDPVVIFAARDQSFMEYLKSNQDVNNRFTRKFMIPDMNVNEMYELALSFFNVKFTLEQGFREKLKKRLVYLSRDQQKSNEAVYTGKNGFLVRKEVDKIINDHFNSPDVHLYPTTLREDDITGKVAEIRSVEEVIKDLDDMVGMTEVKQFIRKLMNVLAIDKKDADRNGEGEKISAHMVLTGNPGTGKTTLALKLGEVLLSAGILPGGHVVNADRSILVGQYVGETAKLVQKYCDEAMGGILFIDEAYMLKQDDQDRFGQEAIDTLMKRMEDDRGKFVVIAAGYPSEMTKFINSNPGIRSRFNDNFFHFRDYTEEELYQIFQVFAKKGCFSVLPQAEKKIRTYISDLCRMKPADFANGREMRNLYDKIKQNRAARISDNPADYNMNLIAEDIPGNDVDVTSLSIDDLLAELNSKIGMNELKTEIHQLIDFLEGQKIRMESGGQAIDPGLHFVFTGNPGTGKTTIARILGKVFKTLGFLKKGHVVEVMEKDLVSQYISNSSANTSKVIDSAMGGILFIDEAYTLVPGPHNYNQEVIDTLLKRMEDDRGRFIVIAAGYPDKMKEFLNSNPGLESRFTKFIHFSDYNKEELEQIILQFFTGINIRLTESAAVRLRQRIDEMHRTRTSKFGNGRDMRKEFSLIMQRQSARVAKSRRAGIETDPFELQETDIYLSESGTTSESVEDTLKKLNALIGLQGVKETVNSLIYMLQADKLRGSKTPPNLHLVFTGNPGTGKTTVARMIAAILKKLGVLPSSTVTEVTDKDLVAGFVGQTAGKTNQVIESAMGGVLFIDEAYTLTGNTHSNFNDEAISTLLKRMEDDRGKFTVIAAGYANLMEKFLDSNPGLDSRFSHKIHFDDYSPDELMRIMKYMIGERDMILDPNAETKLQKYISNVYQNRDHRFANARTVRNILEFRILPVQSIRIVEETRQNPEINPSLILASDIPEPTK